MLTLKSRFNNFAKRQGQPVTAADLDVLKKVISEDIINFRGNVSYGFTADIAKEIVNRITVSKDAKICLLTDTSFHLLLALLEAGFKHENIYIAAGKWTTHKNKAVPSSTDATYMILKRHAAASFNEEINIIKLEEMFNLKFDLIIANPPYGKIGAQITERIIKDVDFKEFIDLLPIKDMPSVGLDACAHIDMSETVVCPPHSFGDADILTHILRITKNANKTYATFEELCADSYFIDKPMVKFMKANVLAEHYAIDSIGSFKKGLPVESTFVFHHFDTGSAHTCGLPRVDSDIPKNKYNFKNIDESVDGRLYGVDKALSFATVTEKQNFSKFITENRNFVNRMIANQFITLRNTAACFPKVDWTKDDWTVEKILKAVAGYIDEEVQAVLNTMDKDYTIKDDASIERLFGEYFK